MGSLNLSKARLHMSTGESELIKGLNNQAPSQFSHPRRQGSLAQTSCFISKTVDRLEYWGGRLTLPGRMSRSSVPGPRRRSPELSSPASIRHPTPVSQYSHPHPMPISHPTDRERTDGRPASAPMSLVTLFTLTESFSQPPLLPPQRGLPRSQNAINPAKSPTTEAVEPEPTTELPLVRSHAELSCDPLPPLPLPTHRSSSKQPTIPLVTVMAQRACNPGGHITKIF